MTVLGWILVIGATGNVGRQVVAQEVEAGAELRAMVRDPAKATFPPGVDVARGEEVTRRVPRPVRRWAFDHAEACR
jgi:uncharacterized protein YbjT (DUF2867 family)